MSRVFEKPRYKDTCRAMWSALRGEYFENILVGSAAPDLASLFVSAAEHDEDAREELLAFEMGMGKDPARTAVGVECSSRLNAFLSSKASRWVYDDSAVFELFFRHVLGEVNQGVFDDTRLCKSEVAGKTIATIGSVAGFLTAVSASETIQGFKWYGHLKKSYPILSRCLVYYESYRLGMNSLSAREHLRGGLDRSHELEPEKLKVGSKHFREMFPDIEVYAYLGLTFHFVPACHGHEATMYVMDKACRDELSDVLYSAPMWVVAAANHQAGDASKEGYEAVRYVATSLKRRRAAGIRMDTLAMRMKKSYAIILAGYEKADDLQVVYDQIQDLESEVTAVEGSEVAWHKHIEGWSDRLKVDVGTAWNLLPGADCDPYMLSKNLKEKMNTPKEYSEEAWDDFLAYSRGVISAHLLFEFPCLEVTWHDFEPEDDEEEPAWAAACRGGSLKYPDLSDRSHIQGCIKWDSHLEFWHYTAKDVTHVVADRGTYMDKQTAKNVGMETSNELAYTLLNGSVLSNKFSPAQIRESWLAGNLPGDRVTLLAAKRENTKPCEKTRDTHSGDDIMRECLTEIDKNFTKIGRCLNGVALRAGRSELETKVGSIISSVNKGDILVSLDVSGWSPNAPRKKHLEFQDMLCGFFRTGHRVSAVFKDPEVISSRLGICQSFVSTDGSIQGFFGCGDTILHTLMAQWAFNRVKRKGGFSRDSIIRKVALIDDILIRLSKFKEDPVQMTRGLIAEYRSLGYEAEFVKTLISGKKGHFLNRLYANGYEIPTSTKIFSKANREYMRNYTTIWEQVDSVFGSYLGASDRGADGLKTYTCACIVAVRQMLNVNDKIQLDSIECAVIDAFLPRAFGGWGFPSVTSWATRDSTHPITAGLGVMSTVARCFRESAPSISRSIWGVFHKIASCSVEKRTNVSVADDPYSVRLSGCVDPATPVHSLMSKAARNLAKSPEFRSLLEIADSQDYEDDFGKLLRGYSYPAAVISEWSSTMPHSVIRSLTTAAERNESLLLFVSHRERHKARNELRDLNKAAVVCRKRVLGSRIMLSDVEISGLAVHSTLQDKQMAAGGYTYTSAVPASISDTICQTVGTGLIDVYIPAHTRESVHTGIAGSRTKNLISRSATSKPLVSTEGVDWERSNPVNRAYVKMSSCCAVVRAYGGDPRPMNELWSRVWVGRGEVAGPTGIAVKGTNPNRLSARIAKRTFSVMAYPNSVGSISVDMHKAIDALEGLHLTLPMLGIVYFLKCAAVFDMATYAMSGAQIVRKYTIRSLSHVESDPPDLGPNSKKYDFRCRKVTDAGSGKQILDDIAGVEFLTGGDLEAAEGADDEDFDIIEFEVSKTLRKIAMGSIGHLINRAAGLDLVLPPKGPAPDVGKQTRGQTPHEAAFALSGSREEQEVIRFALTCAIVDPNSRAEHSDKAKALAADYPGVVGRLGLTKDFEMCAEGNTDAFEKLSKSIISAATSREKHATTYYDEAATKLRDRMNDPKVPKPHRYYSHCVYQVMLGWRTIGRGEYVKAMEAVRKAAISFVENCTKRSMGSTDREQINEMFRTARNLNSTSPGEFGTELGDRVCACFPDDWRDLSDIRAGCSSAFGKVYSWWATDFVAAKIASTVPREVSADRHELADLQGMFEQPVAAVMMDDAEEEEIAVKQSYPFWEDFCDEYGFNITPEDAPREVLELYTEYEDQTRTATWTDI